ARCKIKAVQEHPHYGNGNGNFTAAANAETLASQLGQPRTYLPGSALTAHSGPLPVSTSQHARVEPHVGSGLEKRPRTSALATTVNFRTTLTP
ncbi:MAG: hypothetical protein L0Z50_20700, partial [Verrucomicrobiales bacterium]|nr:hypothetical protein [Verrucomicrobiales bacterium]